MPDPSIQVAAAPDGSLTYAVTLAPEALPAVTPLALEAAWDAARDHAAAGHWGPVRKLLFRRPDGSAAVLALADPDARSWAEAVDRRASLGTLAGLALCLRLLALIEVMGRSAWMTGLFTMAPDGIELHPALLRAASTLPLDSGARFDAEMLRGLLSRGLPGSRVPA